MWSPASYQIKRWKAPSAIFLFHHPDSLQQFDASLQQHECKITVSQYQI